MTMCKTSGITGKITPKRNHTIAVANARAGCAPKERDMAMSIALSNLIIGGADGPTAVVVASKPQLWTLLLWAGAILLVALGLILILKHRK